MHPPHHQVLLLQLAQALGEQPIGEARHGVDDRGEVVRAVGQRPEDRARPAPADQLDRRLKVGADPP